MKWQGTGFNARLGGGVKKTSSYLMTFSYSSSYLSVPFSWVTWYCRGVSRFLSSCWEKTTLQFFLSLHDPGKREDMGEGVFLAWTPNPCFGWPPQPSFHSPWSTTRPAPSTPNFLELQLTISLSLKRILLKIQGIPVEHWQGARAKDTSMQEEQLLEHSQRWWRILCVS